MVKCKFNDWPLNRQAKLCILPSIFIISIAFLIVSDYLLSRLHIVFDENYSNLLEEKELNHIKILGLNHKDYITAFIRNKVVFIEHYRDINRLALGLTSISPPSLPNEPIYHTFYEGKPSNYSNGCFMSPLIISEEGLMMMKKQAAMDQILPIIRNEVYLYIYSAFETDEIIHYYPAELTSDPEYTPKIREWYYKSKDLLNHTLITEPYFDFTTGLVVITISTSILDKQGNFFGVSACDVTLKTLTVLLSNIKILQHGFLLLVSSGGMILNSPLEWGITLDAPLRVYDQEKTGISQEFWTNILNSYDEKTFEYKRDSTVYMIMKYSIRPFGDAKISHYLLILINKEEIYKPYHEFSNKFNYFYTLILSIVISTITFCFLMNCILVELFLRSTLKIFLYIERTFQLFASRASFHTVFHNYHPQETNEKGLFGWVSESIKQRLEYLKFKEKNFEHFEWGSSRPSDKMIYYSWKQKTYPINSFEEMGILWRESIEKIAELSKVTKRCKYKK